MPLNKIECDTSRAVDRALTLLDTLSCSDSPLGTRELARSLSYPLTATHRLLASLEAHGFVQKDQETEKYSPGTKILQLGSRLLEKLDFRRVAIPIMRDMRDRCNETVDLFIADGLERVCVESVQSRQSVRWVAAVGTRLPIHAGAAGKVLLAYLPPERLDAVLSKNLEKVTASTITDSVLLRHELEMVRLNGWACSVGEGVTGNACVAAPIWGGMPPRMLAAMSISAPDTRFTQDQEQFFVELVRGAAAKVSAMLGAPTSVSASADPR
jgi:DNA-binding IclR family transcriptional regulator